MRIALTLLALLASLAQAQDPASPPSPCSGDDHRAFDFWIGDWTVTQNGQPAGTNRIERIDNGCALSESWTSATSNFTGHSLNFYDPSTRSWHQLWVDSSGGILRLRGGLQDGPVIWENTRLQVMVLEGVSRGPGGEQVMNRITWTPNDQDGVRQHWETSEDGQNWETAFDGLYTRRQEARE